jgi:MFS family permease
MRLVTSKVLAVIVFAQFAGTSLWFAGNAVLGPLQQSLGLPASSLSHLTTAVQLGFITGTLVFAIVALPDRLPTRHIFLAATLCGALCNTALLWASSFADVLAYRFLTGFCLAGIYPIGMKIAADWFPQGLGKALGWLVGALVLGTAFPHLFRSSPLGLSAWANILLGTSLLAAVGGGCLFFIIPKLPSMPTAASTFQLGAIFSAFGSKAFRDAALGYFGHMWELYTFWAFVPIIWQRYAVLHSQLSLSIPLWSFLTIGVGMLGCVVGGFWSKHVGSVRVAQYSLMASGLCCLLLPWAITLAELPFMGFMLGWGVVVAADSPQLSTLVARHAPLALRGTALTLSTCLGFSITIVSIQLLNAFTQHLPAEYLTWLLAAGPLLGVWVIRQLHD